MKLIFGKTKRPDAPAEPKPPPPLSYCFMLSHLDEDGPVRLDGVKLGVCEVMGLELDEPKLGAFAGALNALDFPAQLLVRQHPPRLGRLRENLQEAQPESLPPQTKAASESLRRLLTDLEKRDDILDRRFYAVCEFGRIDELRGLLARAGLSVHPLRGRQLRMLLLASALGGTPAEFDEDAPVEVEINPPRHAHRRDPGAVPPPGEVAPLPRSRLPPGADGRRSADGPVRPRRPDSHRAGGQDAGVAEGALRVGAVPLLQAGPHHVPGGGDRPGGHHPSPRRGAAGQGAALPRLSLRHPSREGRGGAQGDDPAGEGPLRRHPGQARQPGLPPARGVAVHPAAGPERRRRVADAGHVQHSPSLPLLAAGPRHPERHPLRHRPAGLLPGGLRPVGRNPPEREYGGAGPLRLRQVFRHQAGRAQGPNQGHHRLRHRPGGRVRGHGPRRWRQGAFPPACPARA